MNVQEIKRNGQNRVEDALVRAVAATVNSKVVPDGAEKYFARRPDDEVSRLVHRAVALPGSLGGSGWASDLATTATMEFATGLGPMSAASQLLAVSLQVPFIGTTTTMNVPGVTPVGAAGGFVEEGEPIPITSWVFDAATLTHKKLAIATVITRELAKSRGAEREIRRLLQASAAITLDSVMFSSNAATDAAPAGLFYGLSAISSGGFDSDPMVDDLASLVAAVAPIGGDRIAYVTSPARAAQISIRAPNLRYPVFASSAVPNTRIAAVAIDGLAAAIDPVPDIAVSAEAVLHMSSVPLELVSDTGPTTADPVRSLFQTSALAIRLILDMDWALRDPGAIAHRDGLAW